MLQYTFVWLLYLEDFEGSTTHIVKSNVLRLSYHDQFLHGLRDSVRMRCATSEEVCDASMQRQILSENKMY